MFQDNQPQQPVTPQSQEPEVTQTPTTPEPPQAPEKQVPVTPQKPATPVVSPEKTTQEERMWAAIGYIAFLGVVSLAIKPKSAFCKHHATRGLVIFAFWFVSLILLAMPSFIGVVGGLLLLGLTGLSIFGIIKSIQSYKLDLPVLSSLADKVPVSAIIGSVTGKTPEVTKPSEAKPIEAETQPTKTENTQENVEQVVPTTEQISQTPKQSEVESTPTEQPEIVQPKPVQSDKPAEKQDPPLTPPQV
ncbi:hypothetical protein J7J83_00890 [bacterium]|nr:hypothetical protein [bacterium]